MGDNVTEKCKKEIGPIIETPIELFVGMEFWKHEKIKKCYKKNVKSKLFYHFITLK